MFQIFQGYNRPGHRKRAAGNFSHTDLESYLSYSVYVSTQWLLIIDEIVTNSSPFVPILLNDHSPVDARHWYNFLQLLKGGLSLPVVHLSFKTGNNIGDLHYVWHGNTEDTDVALLEKNIAVLRNFSHHFQSIAPMLQCLLSLDEYLLELNLLFCV